MAEKSKFFTYKGYPLVRKGNEIYYGKMTDEHVVWMQILSTEKVGDVEVSTKLRLYKMATDESVPMNEKIKKTTEKTSLYDALDIAYAWIAINAG